MELIEVPPRKEASPAHQQYEHSMVGIFGEIADLFGNPRSHGQIYGLLFTADHPLLMEDIARRVGISLGATSLGLRALEELGAIQRETRGRTGLYTAKSELKTLINGFIRYRLMPRLERNSQELQSTAELLTQMNSSEAQDAEWRLQRVIQWHKRAQQFLPLAEKILQSVDKFLPSVKGV
jgi:DNA-binding transcriptional regulator GbsR (MarR family)